MLSGNPGRRRLTRRGFTNQIDLILAPAVVDTLWLLHRAEGPLSARASRALEWLKARLVDARPKG